jgi:3-methyl-2-oxobutanoate hydroxymethyltransferase
MRLTLKDFAKKYESKEKITMVTIYDASFAAAAEQAGVDILFIGDSLGMTVQGHDSPLPVTVEDMVYHTRAVVRGSKQGFVIGDLPFGAYHESPAQAFRNAAQLMMAGANMAEAVEFLTKRGIPVCGHIGLTPQSHNALGGFRVQGKSDEGARQLLSDAKTLQDAGMSMVVVEAVPAALGKELTASLSIPTIGIGAGPDCSGQVLLAYDLLDIFPGKKAKFVKNFMATSGSVTGAFANFVKEVKAGTFPGPEHCY